MDLIRIKQVLKYGWRHAGQISLETSKSRISIFLDIVCCFSKYKMWSNQYMKEKFWSLTKEERNRLGEKYLSDGTVRDEWQKDFRENRRFFMKYAGDRYELPKLRKKRNDAYKKRFHTGENLFVGRDVELRRHHYLHGTISIGANVNLSEHVYIDYSGEVIIEDNVHVARGVRIETHSHGDFLGDDSDKTAIPKKLVIHDSANVLSNAFICESCHSIGRGAVIGAGSVLRSNVPPYAIVAGNPAKIIGFKATPEEIAEYEKKHYSESDRILLSKIEKNYKKYYYDRISEIASFVRL